MPSGPKGLPKIVDPETIKYIQRVIKETVTPSWINSVPSNYGQNSAGTIKANEWRILSTIYLPIALVTLWGDNRHADEKASYMRRALDHTMALFQAVIVVCRYTMTPHRARTYRNLMKQWVDDLYEVHPHVTKHQRRPNLHASLHLYDFLLSFGPVIHWWCFPFERLIGTLQKINTNEKIGGMHNHFSYGETLNPFTARCHGDNHHRSIHAWCKLTSVDQTPRLPRSCTSVQASL
jgi:hypothetical protein